MRCLALLSLHGCTVTLGCPREQDPVDTEIEVPDPPVLDTDTVLPPATTPTGDTGDTGDTDAPVDTDDTDIDVPTKPLNAFALSSLIVWDAAAQEIGQATWDGDVYRSYFVYTFLHYDVNNEYLDPYEFCLVTVYLEDANPIQAPWADADDDIYFGIDRAPDDLDDNCIGATFQEDLETLYLSAITDEVGVGFGAMSEALIDAIDTLGEEYDEFTIGGYYQIAALSPSADSVVLGNAYVLDANLEVVEDATGNVVPYELADIVTVPTAAYETESFYFYYYDPN